MNVPVSLSLSGDQHEHLKSFLFPGDEKEAVALLLCGRRAGDRRERLMVREIHDIPYDHCTERTAALGDLATGLHYTDARPGRRGGLIGSQGALSSYRLHCVLADG